MVILKYILCFLVSGVVITSAVILSEIGNPFLAALIMVLPNMSLIAFYFINKSSGLSVTLTAIKSSLLGTLMVWSVYMLALLYFAPKVGVNKALIYSLLVSIVVGFVFILFSRITLVKSWLTGSP